MASNLSILEKLCGNSPIWNETLLFGGSYPQFTECFREVALVWSPCLLFLVISPFYLTYLCRRESSNLPLPAGFINVSKTLCSLVLFVITVVLLTIKSQDSQQDDIMDAIYVSEGLKAACFLLSMVFIQLERRKEIKTSPILWLFWLVMFLTSIVPFYTYIIENAQETDNLRFITFYVYFAFLLIQLLLSSFVDKRKEGTYYDLSRTTFPSPELNASFPNRLSFWWLTGLVIRGYKKTLTEEDVYDLTPSDSSDANIPGFDRAWEKEQARVQPYNDRIRSKSFVKSSRTKSKYEGLSTEETPLIKPQEKSHKLENGLDHRKDAKDGKEEKPKSPFKKPSLLKVLFLTAGPLLLSAQILKALMDMLTFATPKITEALLNYVSNRDFEQEWKGYTLACSYFVVQLIVSTGSNQAMLLSRRVGMRIKSVLIAAVYKKSLTIQSISDDTTTGEIVNLMSVDCQRMEDVCFNLYLMFSMPFQMILALYLLYEQLNVAVFAGFAVMLLTVPANSIIGHFLKVFQIRQMKLKDQRIKLMTEMLAGMKVLKLYAWEGSFEQKVEAIRKQELNVIKKFSYIIGMLIFIFNSMPYMVQLTAFGVYIAISENGYLNPQVAFVSLQLFNLLNIPLTILPLFIPTVVQAGVSIKRISSYLNREDIKPDVIKRDMRSESAVKISDGEFTWDKEQALPTLRNINLEVQPGSLVAVVGRVGCGKSSLLSAILGEMEKNRGEVTIQSSVAYVPQEAWIQNATLRDNILFGSRFSRRKYDKVIEACALKADLEILQGGDRTEIGEKGINISGGQKQRVSLARAVYSDHDIYLLDDPLSAVDSHVGKHIFQHVVGPKGVLKNKTRILVTHGIHWLPMVDSIFVIVDGSISEVGTYDELLSRDGAFAQFLREHMQEEREAVSEDEEDPEVEAMKRSVMQRLESVSGPASEGMSSADDIERSIEGQPNRLRHRQTSVSSSSNRLKKQISQLESKSLERQISELGESAAHYAAEMESSLQVGKVPKAGPALGEKLTEVEQGETGKVKSAIYFYYFKAIGLIAFTTAVSFYAMFGTASIFSGIWLSMWTDDKYLQNTSRSGTEEYKDRTNMYLAVYGASGVGQGLFILAYALLAASKMADAAGKLHKAMLVNVLRSPMSFFDTTPNGRIVNRFSRDVEVIDNNLPATMRQACAGIIRVISTIVTISYGVPIFLSVSIPLAILYVIVQMIYIRTSRQLRRIDSITRSPIYVHFSETLSGAASIRAYGVQQRFMTESKKRVDYNFKFYFSSIAASAWLGFRLQFLGNCIVLAAALFAVTSTNIEAGIVGLVVSYATQMTQSLEWLVNSMSEVEINIVSVERIKEYTETMREAQWILSDYRPDPEWPQSGHVVFDNYQTRYRPGLDLVLRDLSCNIKGGEKIGVVGRTGAGKSSMTVALFRIIEAAGGKIVIDGEDIGSMGLHDLRSKLTILPQDPVIFSGSLRMNLDPFDAHTDAELWDALDHAHLRSFVESLAQGLAYECGEGGSNLSVGQRQLVCLARTLLRRTKILVLDEATAAVDFETDELIQKTIRREFKDSTVLTIAHRLNTIMDYDRVMVLDKGSIIEFNSPTALLSDKSSVFYGMAKDAGLV